MRQQKVSYSLNHEGIIQLTKEEKSAILRAADELINTGGRSMLAKILKGSKDQKVLQYELDKCPSYGFYKKLSLPEITQRIDRMIIHGYLSLEYSGRLPFLIFTPKGWDIEKETYTKELFIKLQNLLNGDDYSFVEELKDKNREIIMDLIDKIKETKNPDFIPLLRVWQLTDYKKIILVLQSAINHLLKYK